MTTYATFEDLVSDDPDDNAQDVLLPSGRWVRVRGLTRHELFFNGKGIDDNAVLEVRNVKACLIQPAGLTVDQIKEWQRQTSAGGDFKVISEKIRELSGMGEGADKSDPGADRE